MSWKNYLICALISLIVLLCLVWFQNVPGYMDAEYYYSMGLRIAKSGEFSEPFVWNYLSGANSVPHSGFDYWMPLPALVAAIGMWVMKSYSFGAARIGPVILACAIPPLTMFLSYRLTARKSVAFLAGALAVLPAFYSVFITTTDSFAIVMVLGGIFVILALREKRWYHYALIGVVAGLLHLTRADGLVWLFAGVVLVWESKQQRGLSLAALLGGYLIVMGPWMVRNLRVLGTILPAGSSRMFWLREYNDLFTYRVKELNFKYWVAQGWKSIVTNVLLSTGKNLMTAIFIQGQLVLLPLMIVGIRRNWRLAGVRISLVVWAMVFIIMSAVFPFAGMRGGFLHSGAVLQPLLWALAADGFQAAITWGEKKRGWKLEKGLIVFGSSLVILLGLASAFIYNERVIGGSLSDPIWEESFQSAQEVGEELASRGVNGLVMINNPPGLYAATGLSAVVIPSGGTDVLLEAAREFGAEYIVLEPNHPLALDELYRYPEDEQRLIYMGRTDGTYYFAVPE